VGAAVKQNLAGTLADVTGAGFTLFAPTNSASRRQRRHAHHQ
jgi:hypothetical protein